MAKVTLNSIGGAYSTTTLNANFQAIESWSDLVLSRDGTSPNYLIADLDINSNRIINCADAENNTDVPNWAQVKGYCTGVGDGTISTTSHSGLSDLDQDDHPQYLTYTRAQDNFYTESEVDTLVSGYASASHLHTAVQVTDFQTAAEEYCLPLAKSGSTVTDVSTHTSFSGSLRADNFTVTSSGVYFTGNHVRMTRGIILGGPEPTNNQVMTWSTASGIWYPGTPTTVTAADDLSDVTITAAAAGEYLRYSGAAWVDSALLATDLTGLIPTASYDFGTVAGKPSEGDHAHAALYQGLNVNLTEIAATSGARGSVIVGDSTPEWAELTIGTVGKVLTSDGTDATWETPASGVTTFALLTDVDVSLDGGPNAGDIAVYEAVGGTWDNTVPELDLMDDVDTTTTHTISDEVSVPSIQFLTRVGGSGDYSPADPDGRYQYKNTDLSEIATAGGAASEGDILTQNSSQDWVATTSLTKGLLWNDVANSGTYADPLQLMLFDNPRVVSGVDAEGGPDYRGTLMPAMQVIAGRSSGSWLRHGLDINWYATGTDHGNCLRMNMYNDSSFGGGNTGSYLYTRNDQGTVFGYHVEALDHHGTTDRGTTIGYSAEMAQYCTMVNASGFDGEVIGMRIQAVTPFEVTGWPDFDEVSAAESAVGLKIMGNEGANYLSDPDAPFTAVDMDVHRFSEGIWLTENAVRVNGYGYRDQSVYGAIGIDLDGTYSLGALRIKSDADVLLDGGTGDVKVTYASVAGEIQFWIGGVKKFWIDSTGGHGVTGCS